MKNNKLSRQNYIVVWCIMLLSIMVSCNQQTKFNYPEAEIICQKYTDQYLASIEDIENDEFKKKLYQSYDGCLVNGADTVTYHFKEEAINDSLKKVYITGDDSTRVICKMKGYGVLSLIEKDENGDTIYNYPKDQKKLNDYVIFVYVDPVCTIKGNDSTYKLTTQWLTKVRKDEIYIGYISKRTSVSNRRITSISAKISKNGELIECNDHEMHYMSEVENWMKKDPYYAKKANKEIKSVLESLGKMAQKHLGNYRGDLFY